MDKLVQITDRQTALRLAYTLAAVPAAVYILVLLFPSSLSPFISYGRFQAHLPKYFLLLRDSSLWRLFYIVGCTVCFLTYAIGKVIAGSMNTVSSIYLVLFSLQVLRRLYECCFVQRFFGRRVSWTAASASLFYVLSPSLPVLESELRRATPPPVFVTVAALLLFAIASYHQFKCHVILANLRASPDKTPRPHYGIPRGDWFEWLTSPHYTAEILIYSSLLLLTGGRLVTLWLLYAFVLLNLLHRGGKTHQWYLMTFPEFAMGRWAVIPYVY